MPIEPLAMTAVARATAAPAWAIVSPMVLGKWAMPARKTPSVAKSTGRSFMWASRKNLSAVRGTLSIFASGALS